ncbi:hypothetical protein [Flavilitoribacter nigricans]|uniref:Uncharacterized protein n=1 Tax=Flavilitoribacter nigricans (strain ATCC 23147 / DSM 23189 / NBRC 102662 / NCIMB 1420 / SS-2) TaxID=1122177 RepID=A0A2D0MX04_FLAN2|nr:hypothetical protein [Flavilitoribacter nigricans]PHN00801.1 hypothetical protein CRP01_40380 [Flavilitoribacter nigricans DSM 23189 = NBRC 102662]
MKVSRRTDINTAPLFDIRFINDKLEGQYDNIYFILTTLEDEPTDAWEDQGDSFLLIQLPKEKIKDASIDYKEAIISNLPKLSWLQSEELVAYIEERWN